MMWPVANQLTASIAKPLNSIRQRLPLNKPQIPACSYCKPLKFKKKSCYPTRFTSATTICQIVSSKIVVSLNHRRQNWWFNLHTKAITTKLHLGTKVVVEPHETQIRANLISRASEGRRKVVTMKKTALANKKHHKTNTLSKLKLSPQSSCIGWLARQKSQTQLVLRQSLSVSKLLLLRSV